MRSFIVPLCLLVAAPLCAEGEPGHWFLDVHSVSGTLDGHYIGLQSGNDFSVDLKNDLGIGSKGTKPGFGLEYQGHRFGLELSSNQTEFTGSQAINRQVTINGQSFSAGALVNSDVKFQTTTFNWTIRALTWDNAWVGIDLGVRAINVTLDATGYNALSGVSAWANYKGGLPLPQVGLSTGVKFMEGRVLARAYYHTLNYKSASFVVTGADVRVFPLSWLGVMAYVNQAKLNVPQSAINDSANVVLNQNTTGGGVVLRF